MKLRNKKTGMIGELHFEPDKEYHFTVATEDPADMRIYKTLEALCQDWEDYEEPKDFWFIDDEGDVEVEGEEYEENLDKMKSIGNYFSTKEEAEKAVEKLKAWKRLKDRGFTKIFSIEYKNALCGGTAVSFKLLVKDKEMLKDLDICFGGEE